MQENCHHMILTSNHYVDWKDLNIIPTEARGEEYCHQGVYSFLLGM